MPKVKMTKIIPYQDKVDLEYSPALKHFILAHAYSSNYSPCGYGFLPPFGYRRVEAGMIEIYWHRWDSCD